MPYVITVKDVGARFAARIRKRYLRDKYADLEYMFDDYAKVLKADNEFTCRGEYELTDPDIDEYPELTWRQVAEQGCQTLEELAGGFNLTPEQYDRIVPVDCYREYLLGICVDGRESAFDLLHGMMPGVYQRDDPTDAEAPLGYVDVYDGPMPGSNYQAVVVSSELALACYQRFLDRKKSGIRLEL